MHCDPKVGIPLYGPRSLGTGRHKREVHVGFVGAAEGIAQAQEYYADCAQGVDGDEEHAPFPGCSQDIGYRCDLRMDGNLVETITRKESLDVLGIRDSREGCSFCLMYPTWYKPLLLDSACRSQDVDWA